MLRAVGKEQVKPVAGITVDNLFHSGPLASLVLWYACVVDKGV